MSDLRYFKIDSITNNHGSGYKLGQHPGSGSKFNVFWSTTLVKSRIQDKNHYETWNPESDSPHALLMKYKEYNSYSKNSSPLFPILCMNCWTSNIKKKERTYCVYFFFLLLTMTTDFFTRNRTKKNNNKRLFTKEWNKPTNNFFEYT